jgi:hypothetical protein
VIDAGTRSPGLRELPSAIGQDKAETLRGHARTLQSIALDLHGQAGARREPGSNGERDSDAQEESGTARPDESRL